MKDKQRRLLQWIKNQNCSIVFLQETHFNNESKCLLKNSQIINVYVVMEIIQVGGG